MKKRPSRKSATNLPDPDEPSNLACVPLPEQLNTIIYVDAVKLHGEERCAKQNGKERGPKYA